MTSDSSNGDIGSAVEFSTAIDAAIIGAYLVGVPPLDVLEVTSGSPRFEELFGLVRDELRRSGFEELIAAGVVITGGSAKMEGAVELAEEVFHMPVRLGAPQYAEGLMDVICNPIHATGVGLLLYGYENLSRRDRRSTPIGGNLGEVWDRMKSWFQGHF